MGAANPRKVKRRKGPTLKTDVVNQFGVSTGVETAAIGVAAPGKDIPGYLWLRRLAEVQYVTSREGITIEEMAKDELYRGCTQMTLQRWSCEDCWVEKRQKYYEGISQKIQAKIGQGMMREQLRALKEIQTLGAEILTKLRDKQVRVGTYEGLVTAYLKLLDYEGEMQKKVSKEVVHEREGGVRTDTVKVAATLSEAEARVAVDTILKMRREQIRASIQPAEEKKVEAPKPEEG